MNRAKPFVEALLFISSHALSAKKLAEQTGCSLEDVRAALQELMEQYRGEGKGVQLNRLGDSYQFATTGETNGVVQAFLEEEEKKELTKPSLETLTIIAYRGPITKAELELIRGVNCSLILRNLLIRGLIEEQFDKQAMITRYQVTFDFLHYLGIREPRELPEYDKLNSDENLQRLLQESAEDATLQSTEVPDNESALS